MIIKNAHIVTMEDREFENGYISFENGKITALGDMSELTESESAYDAKGAYVIPGMIDAHSHIGVFDDSLAFEGDDGNEDTDPVTPHLSAIDAVYADDICFKEAIEDGVTCVVTGPGSANPIGGMMVALKTAGKYADEMIVKSPVAMKMAFGENPKSVYHGKSQAPSTRMATAAVIREALLKAKRYNEDIEKAEDDEDYDPPDFDMKCEALLPVIRGELPVHFHAHRTDDIATAIRIAKEFNLKYQIVHCTEGHLMADKLAKENVQAFLGPILCSRTKPELKNLTPSAPAMLEKANVPVAIITDHPEIPQQYLRLCAIMAVKYGMSRKEALKSITKNPATLCGINDKVGSLAVGKDADIVVLDGDPLDIMSEVKAVFVNGEQVK